MKPKKVTKAVFPVAGMGTRFLPATKSIPKEIMTLVDRPLIQYAIDEARAAGIKEFIFVTSRLPAAEPPDGSGPCCLVRPPSDRQRTLRRAAAR
jgi:CTP:molybdopterin cytidylyltransferase MocA